MIEDYLLKGVIFLVVIFIGHFCISEFMYQLNYKNNPYAEVGLNTQKQNERNYARMQSGVLGVLERLLYLVLMLEGWFIVIGFWLTLKGIVIWRKWKEVNGRIYFNNFLIGNCMNLIYSFFGYLAFRFVQSNLLFNPSTRMNIFIFFILLFVPYILTLIIRESFVSSHDFGLSKDANGKESEILFKETTSHINENSSAKGNKKND